MPEAADFQAVLTSSTKLLTQMVVSKRFFFSHRNIYLKNAHHYDNFIVLIKTIVLLKDITRKNCTAIYKQCINNVYEKI